MQPGNQNGLPRRHRPVPAVPSGCANCPIGHLTVCQAFAGKLDIVQSFKTGDRILPAGSHVYRIGDKPSELFNLLDGWVAVYRILESGRRQILDILLPGSFLGYQPDLNEQMLQGAVCLSDVALCVFPRKSFPDLIERHPALAQTLVGINARATLRAQDQLTNIGGRSGTTRVAYMLLDVFLRGRKSMAKEGTGALDLPLTQEVIADSLGLTPVYVNRILRDLRERGLVVLRNGTLQIHDLQALVKLVELPPLSSIGTQVEPTPLVRRMSPAPHAPDAARAPGRARR